MTPEIRRAAVRAAAKVALVATLGCSGGQRQPPQNTEPGPAVPRAAPDCDEHLDKLEVVGLGKLADDDPLKNANAFEAFKDIAARTTPRTTECCTQQLVAHGSSAKQRFACCSALDAAGIPGGVPEGAEASACTPWGPPCPPEMV